MATISFDRWSSPPLIHVTGDSGTLGTTPTRTVTVQSLVTTIRDYEDEPQNLDLDKIVDATGKVAFGAVLTGITMEILGAWRIKFADEGSETLGIITGGNTAPVNGDGEPVMTAASNVYYQVEQSTSAGIVQGEDLGIDELRVLVGGLYIGL